MDCPGRLHTVPPGRVAFDWACTPHFMRGYCRALPLGGHLRRVGWRGSGCRPAHILWHCPLMLFRLSISPVSEARQGAPDTIGQREGWSTRHSWSLVRRNAGPSTPCATLRLLRMTVHSRNRPVSAWHVAVDGFYLVAGFFETLGHLFGHHDASVLAAGASECHGQVALAFLHVVR